MMDIDRDDDGETLTFDDGEGVLHASKHHLPACGAWLNNGLKGPYPGIVTCIWCLTGEEFHFVIGPDGMGCDDDGEPKNWHLADDTDHVATNDMLNRMREKCP